MRRTWLGERDLCAARPICGQHKVAAGIGSGEGQMHLRPTMRHGQRAGGAGLAERRGVAGSIDERPQIDHIGPDEISTRAD